MRIVIGSAGRRVYLVRWFQEALRNAGLDGQVYVFENDKNAASVAAADGFVQMPRYEDPDFEQALLSAVEEIRPHLFFSLNDYELVRLSQGLAGHIRARGTVVPSLTLDAHTVVADKIVMYEELNDAGIRVPLTVGLSDFESIEKLLNQHERVVLKDRFGSGSSGLEIVNSDDLITWLDCDKAASTNLQNLVAQPALDGQEYGLDIVTPLIGGPVEAVLARHKLVMRNGETNVAETVEPGQFHGLAIQIAGVLGSQGLIDVDVIRTVEGEDYVIDVNPRFGGGYPFNHVSGANVPYYYVTAIAKNKAELNWREYECGYKSAKYEELVSFCKLE